MKTYCDNCGCKAFNGLCTNCHEESYIAEQNYSNDDPIEFSEEFKEKLTQQKRIKERYLADHPGEQRDD